jgi:hypothetical protein
MVVARVVEDSESGQLKIEEATTTAAGEEKYVNF